MAYFLLIHNIRGNQSIHKLYVSRELKCTARKGHRRNELNAVGLLKLTILYPSAQTSPAHRRIYHSIVRLGLEESNTGKTNPAGWQQGPAANLHKGRSCQQQACLLSIQVISHFHEDQTALGWVYSAISSASGLTQHSISKPKQKIGREWADWGIWQMELPQGPKWWFLSFFVFFMPCVSEPRR